MQRRIRSLRPDAELPSRLLWQEATTADGVTVRESSPPGADREAAVEDMKGELRLRAAGLEAAAEALRELMRQHEPAEFINSIAVPASMRLGSRDPLIEDATVTHTWPAKIEYLLGLAMSLPAGQGHTPAETTETAIELLGNVFDAANARHMVESFDRPTSGNASLDSAAFLLGHEYLTDRMSGYPVHLERIDGEVFDRHLNFYLEVIGFNPADVTRAVRSRVHAVNDRFNSARREMAKGLSRQNPRRAAAFENLLMALNETHVWSIDSVAADTGIDNNQVAAMLDFFSTTFDCQPDFRLPADHNQARTTPCVRMPDGATFIADPWSLPTAVHARLVEVLTGSPLNRYHGHRERGLQRIVASALRQVFGDRPVLENQHYDNSQGKHGEIDVLIASEWPLIVEAKSHSLTPAGRRGALGRVSRVASNVINNALEQTARARSYIFDEDGRAFSNSEGATGVDLLPRTVVGSDELIVTFERMDPLVLEGADVVGSSGRQPWTLCAADLLMVADLLDDPASFHHYARTRRAARELGVKIYVESDALGGYLIDRLGSQIELARSRPDATVTLGHTSWAINDHFNRLELGMATSPPSTNVPVAVRQALEFTFGCDNAGAWADIADAVLGVRAPTWKRWKRFARHHRSADAAFALTDRVRLTVGPAAAICMVDRGIVALQVTR